MKWFFVFLSAVFLFAAPLPASAAGAKKGGGTDIVRIPSPSGSKTTGGGSQNRPPRQVSISSGSKTGGSSSGANSNSNTAGGTTSLARGKGGPVSRGGGSVSRGGGLVSRGGGSVSRGGGGGSHGFLIYGDYDYLPPPSNASLAGLARHAVMEVNELHDQYRYSKGFRDDEYWEWRAKIDEQLKRQAVEAGLLDTGSRRLAIPSDVLYFPKTLSLLVERGADLVSVPPGEEFSPLAAAFRRREPTAVRKLIQGNIGLINTKTGRGTPLIILVLKKIRDARDEATFHYGRPSCPPSCYNSWRKTAKGWDTFANEILNQGVVDFTLRDAKGELPLITAFRLDLDIFLRIFREGGDDYLTDGDISRLKRLAHEKGDISLERRLSVLQESRRASRVSRRPDEPRRVAPPADDDEAFFATLISKDPPSGGGAIALSGPEEDSNIPSGGEAIPLSGPEGDSEGGDCSSGIFRNVFRKIGRK